MTSASNDIELATSNADSETESIENELHNSSYDEEKPKVEKQCGEEKNAQCANLALLPLLMLLLALQFSLLLSQYIVDNDNGAVASVCLVTSIGFGIIALVILFEQIWAGKVHERDSTGLNMHVNELLRNNMSLVGIVFFCPFACLLDIFQILTEVSCGESWKMIDAFPFYVSDVVYSVSHIVFMAMELLFCVQFRRLVLKQNVSKVRRFLVKLSLTLVVAANLGLWFNAILHETASAGSGRHAGNDSHHSSETCLIRAFGDVEETVRRSLYPFSVEFSLLVLQFVTGHLIFHSQHKEHEIERDQCVEPSSENLQEPRRVSLKSISGDHRSFFFGVTSPLVVIFGILPNLVFFVLAFISRNNNFNIDILRSAAINKKRFMIVYRILLIFLITVGFICARKFKSGKDKLKGIDYLVMASAFGPFLCFLMRIIFITEQVEKVNTVYNPAVILFSEVLNLIEVLLQLPFMFYADGVEGPSEEEGKKPQWRIFKAAVLSLALGNITLWILDSVLLNVDIVSTIFRGSRVAIIDVIFRPLIIFFRFHSFLILLRAFLL